MEFTNEELEQIKTLGLVPAWRGMIFNQVSQGYETIDETAVIETIKGACLVERVIKAAMVPRG